MMSGLPSKCSGSRHTVLVASLPGTAIDRSCLCSWLTWDQECLAESSACPMSCNSTPFKYRILHKRIRFVYRINTAKSASTVGYTTADHSLLYKHCYFQNNQNNLEQWSCTWGTRTPRSMREDILINQKETKEKLETWTSSEPRSHEDSPPNWGSGIPKTSSAQVRTAFTTI
jgi:hypothetical protein